MENDGGNREFGNVGGWGGKEREQFCFVFLFILFMRVW